MLPNKEKGEFLLLFISHQRKLASVNVLCLINAQVSPEPSPVREMAGRNSWNPPSLEGWRWVYHALVPTSASQLRAVRIYRTHARL